MVSTLVSLGIIGGLTYLLVEQRGSAKSPTEHFLPPEHAGVDKGIAIPLDQAPPTSGPSPTIDDVDSFLFVPTRIQEGDALLAKAQFAAAGARYLEAQQASGLLRSDLSLRLGLCAEFSGQHRSALSHYRRAIELRASGRERWIAQLGMCRMLLARGSVDESLPQLCEIYLDLTNGQAPTELMAQVQYELTAAAQELALRNYHGELSRPDGIAFHHSAPRIEDIIGLLRSPDESTPELVESPASPTAPVVNGHGNEDGLPQFRVVQRPSNSLDMMFVEIDSPMIPVAQFVMHLCAECQLNLFATPGAETALRGRSKRIQVETASASMVIDCLLMPLQVGWFQDERGVHLFSLQEDASVTEGYWNAVLDRMLRRFTIMFPGDHRNAAVLLSRANLAYIQNDLDRAAQHYQELAQRNLAGEILAKLFFNLGKVELRLGRTDSAIRQFYLALDQSFDPDLQACSYWHVGQLYLESNSLLESIRASGRALSLARNDQQKRLAAMTMARAYLLANQALSANQVLFDNRHLLQGSPYEPAAAVIASLARYVAMTDPINRKTESVRLLSAIANCNPLECDSFLDIYIVARAWQELGFREQAIANLMLAAQCTTLPVWRRQFLFERAVQLGLANEPAQALAIHLELLSETDDQWSIQARVQMAATYLQLDNPSECLSQCEILLTSKISDERRQIILDLMGRAYRALGKHHSAALCFAGVVPLIPQPNPR